MTSQCPPWPLDLASDIIIQGHFIDLAEVKLKVYTVVGALDDLEVTFNNMGFTTKIYVKTSYFQKDQVNLVDPFHLLLRSPLMTAEPPSSTRVGTTSAAELEFSRFLEVEGNLEVQKVLNNT